MSASALFAQGYTDLVKVAAGDKRPVMPGWQNLEVTAEMAAEWDGTMANLGLRGDRFPAVDIDLGDDAETANAIVKIARDKLGGAPVRFSPKSGSRLLVYRTEETFLKMKITLPHGKGAVEVLPTGRQYLVKGIHPAGGPYVWNKVDLWDIRPQNLAVVTEADVLAFLEHLAVEFGGRVHVARESSEAKLSPEELQAPSVEVVAELVALMPNNDHFLETAFPSAGDARDTWVAFGMAVKGAAGDAGLEIFVEWTSRYEDGVPELDLARSAYHGFAPERYGWPTLQRIYRTQVESAEELFRDDILDGVEEGEIVTVDQGEIPTMEDMSKILYAELASRLSYAAGLWWIWDGSRWVQDEKEGLRAELVIRDRLECRSRELHEQGVAMGAKEGAAHRNAAKKFQSSNGISGVKTLLRARHLVDRGGFDSDLMSLNTPGGLVDLRTGKTRPSVPSDYVTRTTNVAMPGRYDPAKAPNWEAFLDHLTYGDDEYRAFLRRYTGYALTGRMDEKKLVFIHGASSNTGKSTFVNAIQYAMGDYAQSVDVDMFMGRRDNTDDLAQLPGVRLVTATEPSAGQKWDDKLLKAITGRDVISCRRLYGSYFSFEPQFKILIAGNHQPELRNVDTALLKRVLISPMDRVAEEPDTQLGEKLREEAGMILRWMLDGCLEWSDRGIDAPEKVTTWTEEYAEEEDTLLAWVEEECVLDPEAWTSVQDLFDSWIGWNSRNNQKYIGRKNLFSRELKGREQTLEVTKVKRSSQGFHGIKLRDVFST